MTNQEAFNKVWDWFVVKGSPFSVGESGSCYYRLGSARCAVGVLIPDGAYKPEMEDWTPGQLRVALPEFSGLDVGLLEAMQAAHDDAAAIGSDFIYLMRDVADKFGLEVPSNE